MKELMHTTPEGLTGADATWAAGVMERDRAARNAALARAEAAEAKLAEVTKERDGLAATLLAFTPDDPDSPMPSPVSFKSAETPSQNRAFLWIVNACIRLCMMEVKRQHPEKQNRLTFPILMGDDTEASWSLTLRREPWESLMEQQRDEARRERDELQERCDRWCKDWNAAVEDRDTLLDEKRQIIEDILAAGARCGCDANNLSVAEVLESMARSAGAHAGMNAATDPLRPIGSEGPWKPRQPDGYDPGARPETTGQGECGDCDRQSECAARGCVAEAADPHAWAKPGVWAVYSACPDPYGDRPPVKLVRLKAVQTDTTPEWVGLAASGDQDECTIGFRRPATPEETARFEAELAKNTAPPDPFEDLQEALSDARRAEREAAAAPIPLAVGQRWVRSEDPRYDAVIISAREDGDVVFRQAGVAPALTHRWNEGAFRLNHPRLRDPSELEPAPDTGWGPKQVDEVTTVTSGPLGDPAPEPLVKLMGDGYGGAWFGPASMFNETKASLPVVPATCGECEHNVECDCTPNCKGRRCLHTEMHPPWVGMRGDPPPNRCPLRKPSDELRSKETP